jgi:hypothetical protein
MRLTSFTAVLIAATLAATTVYGGKVLAEHNLVNSNGFFNSDPMGWGWLPDVALDDKGNVCQFFFTRGADSNITELAYEARDRKDKIYSQGTLPEAVGATTVNMPTSVANGNGGFSKKLLLMGFQQGSSMEYVLYKLGKNGAEKIGSKMFQLGAGDFAVAWMYNGKIVTENGKQVTANADLDLMVLKTEFNLALYNKKFKQSSKGGAFVADQSILAGKKGVVSIDQDGDPTKLTVRIYKQ